MLFKLEYTKESLWKFDKAQISVQPIWNQEETAFPIELPGHIHWGTTLGNFQK